MQFPDTGLLPSKYQVNREGMDQLQHEWMPNSTIWKAKNYSITRKPLILNKTKHNCIPEVVNQDSRPKIPMKMIKIMREEKYSETSVNIVKSDYKRNGIKFNEKTTKGTNPKKA